MGIMCDDTNPFFYISPKGPAGPYTVKFLETENPKKVGKGGSWLIGLDRFFAAPRSYFCWMFGGHTFVEYNREYHYDSSETANTTCTRCGLWVNF